MSVKYFCDVCGREITLEQKITIIGAYRLTKIETVCKDCWSKIDASLSSLSKEIIKNNSN